MPGAAAELDGAVAYAELHIEQGPVLDDAGIAVLPPSTAASACGAPSSSSPAARGTRARRRWTAGRIPLLAAARVRRRRARRGGRRRAASPRSARCAPSRARRRRSPTACGSTLDLRHRDLEALERLDTQAVALAIAAADPEDCTLEHEPVWAIDPVAFDPDAGRARGGADRRAGPLTSGPLHDAAAVARAGVPTVMVFARTRGGISHSREEDADEADLVAAIDAYATLVSELVS